MPHTGYMNKRTIEIDGQVHFLADDANGVLTLWRGEPDDFMPMAVEDSDTCDPFVWALILDRFDKEN